MNAPLQCCDVARAALGEPARQVGAELFWPCPWHEDNHPSFQVNQKKNCFFCGPCDTSGNAWQLAARFAGVNPENKPAISAWLCKRGLFQRDVGRGTGKSPGTSNPGIQRVATFMFSRFLRKVRIEPGRNGRLKEFIWEHLEDGKWISCNGCTHEIPLYVNALSRAKASGIVLGLEGEAKADLAGELGYPAFSYKNLTQAQCTALAGLDIVLWPDNDLSGENQCKSAAHILHESGQPQRIRLITPPLELPAAGDIVDAVRTFGWGKAEIDKLIVTAKDSQDTARPRMPWSGVEDMATFLSADDPDVEFLDLDNRFLARECVTELFAPRGLGKSIFATYLAITCAGRGLRVLYIDRDNPRRIVKSRLLEFGADLKTKNLLVITREKCPPLTDFLAWAKFPYTEYDVVVLDSFDSAAEGIGEQDSSKPSKAIAPILDIVRRENGPAVLLLGNCVRSGQHSRGSGVIEDRADIVYEVRDATEFHPTGSKPWIEELPLAGAGNWTLRASRRKQRERYRLAFVASKFRIAEEPEPFIVEIDTTTNPWSIKDVTDLVDKEGATFRQEKARKLGEALSRSADLLFAEIRRRAVAGESAILKGEAESLLRSTGLTRILARKVVGNPDGRWVFVEQAGLKGHPIGLVLPEKNSHGGNGDCPESAQNADSDHGYFRHPHLEHLAEIDESRTRIGGGPHDAPICADPTPAEIPGKDTAETNRAIVEALGKRPVTCATSCYEAQSGVWIHRPWDGCSTRFAHEEQIPKQPSPTP